MINGKKRRGNRLVMSKRSGICCASCRNRILGWILVRRRSARGKGKGKRGRRRREMVMMFTRKQKWGGKKKFRRQRREGFWTYFSGLSSTLSTSTNIYICMMKEFSPQMLCYTTKKKIVYFILIQLPPHLLLYRYFKPTQLIYLTPLSPFFTYNIRFSYDTCTCTP